MSTRQVFILRIVFNLAFLTGWTAISWAGFEVARALGLLMVGIPFVVVGVYGAKKLSGSKN